MGPGPSPSPVSLARRASGYPPDAHLPPRAAAISVSRPTGPSRGQVGHSGGARYVRPRLPCGLGGGSRRELRPELSLLSRSSSTTLVASDGAHPLCSSPGTRDPLEVLLAWGRGGRKAVEQLVSGV